MDCWSPRLHRMGARSAVLGRDPQNGVSCTVGMVRGRGSGCFVPACTMAATSVTSGPDRKGPLGPGCPNEEGRPESRPKATARHQLTGDCASQEIPCDCASARVLRARGPARPTWRTPHSALTPKPHRLFYLHLYKIFSFCLTGS